MRLGIYGGTFDPVHFGHLLLAECCREQCQLDEVWFLPASVPPHKRATPLTDARQRVEMLELAVGDHESFRVSTFEIERGGVSYTVETLAALREQRPEDELFFLLGADALADLTTWREPARIASLATLVSVRRAGVPPLDLNTLAPILGDATARRIAAHQVIMPTIELSSRDLRARVAAGQSLRYRVPTTVLDYIEQNQLYVAGSEPRQA